MHKTPKILTLLTMSMLVGCGASLPTIDPYKMDIQQGNVVTSEMLLKLRPGMSKSQVQYIMGTPLLIDSFHSDRWDYFYQLRKQGEIVNQRRVVLDFEGDSLARVRGNVVPEGTDINALMQAENSKSDAVIKPAGEKSETLQASVEPEIGVVDQPMIEQAQSLGEPSVSDVSAKLAEEAVKVTAEKERLAAQEAASKAVEEKAGMAAAEARLAAQESAAKDAEEAASLQAEDDAMKAEALDAIPEMAVGERAPNSEATVGERVVKSREVVVERPQMKQIPAPPDVGARLAHIARPARKAKIPAPPVMGPVAKSAKSVLKSMPMAHPLAGVELPEVDSSASDIPLPNEEEPGFFEKTLQKIGF